MLLDLPSNVVVLVGGKYHLVRLDEGADKRLSKLILRAEELLKQYRKNDGMNDQLKQSLIELQLDLNIEGGDCYEHGNFKQAMTAFNLQLEIARILTKREDEGKILSDIAGVCQSLGQFQKGLACYKQALEIAREVGDSFTEGVILNGMGAVYQELGKYEAALDCQNQALRIRSELGDKRGEGSTLNNIGAINCSLGKYQEALEYYQRARTIAESLEDEARVGVTLSNLGSVYHMMGQYQEALDHYSQALTIARKKENRSAEGTALNNMGAVYNSWGNYRKALEFYEQALAIAREVGDKSNEEKSLSNIGSAYHLSGKKYNAMKFYRLALDIAEHLEDRQGEGEISNNIGAIFDSWQRYQKALEFYERALKIKREIGDKAGEATSLSNEAGVYSSQREYQESLKRYEEALSIVEEVGNKHGEAVILGNIAGAQFSLGQLPQSFENLKKSIDIAELLITEAKSGETRQEYRGTWLTTYKSMVNMLIAWHLSDRNDIEKPPDLLFNAFKFLELFKAREILDRLEPGKRQIDLSVICPEYKALISKEQELTNVINGLFGVYYRESLGIALAEKRGSSGEGDQIPRSVSAEQLKHISLELKALRTEIQEHCYEPGLIRLTTDFDPIPSFRELLDFDPNCIIWEFFLDEEQDPYSFKILSWTNIDGIRVFTSNRINLDEGLGRLTEFHRSLDETDFSRENEALAQLSLLLGKWLPDELWQTLMHKDLLILVPHGKLHLFPWSISAKPTNSEASADNGTFLGLLLPVVRSFSLSLVTSCFRREKKMDSKVLFISNPNYNIDEADLPGTEEEVDSIIELLGSGSHKTEILSVLEHNHATKDEFISKVDEAPSIIHFAGHGLYDSQDPWLSHLSFYDGSGISTLTVTEMLLHHFLGSPLFILSACDTARAEIGTGDESIGIIRGLTLAGATSIIATNWSLNDRMAPHFMKRFYSYLLQGEPVANALFKARKAIHDEDGFTDPFDWAVYELYGNPFKTIIDTNRIDSNERSK
jgi:tetratricopeptide (TPR) repeat protein/CHAT domain-containing protein